MTTFSCATSQKNIGESICVKGKLENPSQVMKVSENFTATQAQMNDVSFWTAAIKAKTAVLLPKLFNFETAPIEAAYEETAFGSMKTSQGKYGFRILYNVNIERHKNLFSHDGSLDRHILFDDQGKVMATLTGGEQVDPATNTYTGMKPQLFSVENQIIDPGETTKTPVRILYEDAEEWNVNGYIFTQSVLSQLKSLSTVDLVDGTGSIATAVNVVVTNSNDGSPVRGLLETDFTYTGGVFTGITESSAGVYALAGVGLTTGDLNLVAATASSQFIESSGLINITI